MKKIFKWINHFNGFMGKLCSFIIVPLIGIVIIELVARGVFNSPTSWAHESSGYLLAAYSVLTGGFALKKRGHVNVEIIFGHFSPRVQSMISIFTAALFFYFCIALIWSSGEAAMDSIKVWEHSPTTWGPLYWPIRLLIPIGGILIFLQGAVHFVADIYFVIRGEKI